MALGGESDHGIITNRMARPVIDDSVTGSGTVTRTFSTSAESVTVGMLITAISGTIDLWVGTYDGDDSSTATEIASVQQQSAITSQWIVRKSKPCLSKIIVKVTHSAAATLRVTVKANNTSSDNTESTLPVEVKGPLSAFGEVSTVNIKPTIQLDAVYGLREKQDVEVLTSGTGANVSVVNTGTGNEWKMECGTDVGGYGIVRSQRYNRYRPGQGALYRYTARWPDAGIANATMRAGAITVGNELSFGYNGTNFGLLHRRGGELEIRTLTISAGAGGAETATVTLNGTAFPVSLTAGDTAHASFELGTATYSGYTVYYNDSTVVFASRAVGPETGSFSFSSTGTATGSFAQTNAGVAVTDSFINQEDWNIDPMDGTGPSGMTLDPTKGNVYQIQHQYLGYGDIRYSIENAETGRFTDVHIIKYANANTSPNVSNPSFRVGGFSASLGSTTNLTMYMASMMAGIEGLIEAPRNPDAHYATNAGIDTTLANVVSVRIRGDINGTINLNTVTPLLASCAVDGTKPALVRLLINPTFGGEPAWAYHEGDTTDSIVEIMSDDVAVTLGSSTLEVGSFGVGKAGNVIVNLQPLNIQLKRFDVITLAVAATSGTTDATASLVWEED